MPTAKLIYYRKMIKVANIGRTVARGLERAAKSVGSNPTNWWGAISQINVSDCAVEKLVDGSWVSATVKCGK